MIKISDGRRSLFQWDTGREVESDTPVSQFHFSNRIYGKTLDVDAVENKAKIPDILLQSALPLRVYAYTDGYTLIEQEFSVTARNKPNDYVFTPTEQKSIKEIEAIAQSVRDDADSGKFNGKDGYTPVKGIDYFDGKNGADGKDGLKGDKGDKGETGPAGTTTWNGITDKPSSFPPSYHHHRFGDIVRSSEISNNSIFTIDSAKINRTRACRTAFLPPAGVNIEFSEDGGKTWNQYPDSDNRKKDLVSMVNEVPFYLGGRQKKEKSTLNDMLRITYTAISPWYMSVNTAYMWVSNSGGIMKCLAERNSEKFPDEWTSLYPKDKDDGWFTVSGWGGPNELLFSTSVFGRSVPSFRFTFKMTEINPTYGIGTVTDLRLYGDGRYSGGSNMSVNDQLYTWDRDQNASFPAGMNVNGDLTVSGKIKSASPVWRKIKDITSNGAEIEEDLGKLQAVCLKFPKENTVSDWFSLRFALDGWVGTGNATYMPISIKANNSSYCGAEIKFGVIEQYETRAGTNNSTMVDSIVTSYQDKCTKSAKFINRMYLGIPQKPIPAGVTFELWGVDYVG